MYRITAIVVYSCVNAVGIRIPWIFSHTKKLIPWTNHHLLKSSFESTNPN